MAFAQALHDRLRLHAAIAHGDAGAAHQVAVAALVEHLGQLAPEHGNGRAVAIGGIHAGAADLQHRLVQRRQPVQTELLLAVEMADAPRSEVIEQARGGDQCAAGQIAHADVAAMRIVVIDVQTELGALQASVELAAEHAVAQRLGFAQGGGADQALGLQLTGAAGVSDGVHAVYSCSARLWRVGNRRRLVVMVALGRSDGRVRLGSWRVTPVTDR
ncbi:hypothetical protein SSTU70S_06875 [Stutzerimonas stutzeri]